MSHNGIDHRHCKWPLSTVVWVLTPDGYVEGSINRHEKDHPNRCDVAFHKTVDMGDANGRRYCHAIPFRNIRPVDRVKLSMPWYKESPHVK